jgi:hypothetical protein
MTAVAKPLTGASSAAAKWNTIDWGNTKAEVHRLQMRIAKAISQTTHDSWVSRSWPCKRLEPCAGKLASTGS